MTTRIIVEPAHNAVEITTQDRSATDTVETRTFTTIILKPGAPKFETHIHDSRTLTVREVPAPAAAG